MAVEHPEVTPAGEEDRDGALVALHWIPLGAGQRVVRWSGRAFEAISALVDRRGACDLYHSALVVDVDRHRFSIEVAPIPKGGQAARGVVGEGPVGSRWLGRLRVFRYEVRCWRDGVIPDLPAAVQTVPMAVSRERALHLVDLVADVPTPVWGRDELRAGEMWNSNSVISWLLTVADVGDRSIGPPSGGRAPGWDAGLAVAAGPRRGPAGSAA